MRSKSLRWSIDYAIQGIVYALRTQRNMRIHVTTAVLVLVASLFMRITRLELIALMFAVSMVIVAELVNTAIEATIDLSVETFQPTAKTAKDVAAGAVLVASLNAIGVGYLVFFGRLTPIADRLMQTVRQSAASLTVVALALTAIAVVAAKAVTREGTFLRGGWPSGHTALATALATAIYFGTGSARAFVLGLFLAALVGHSRVESEAHTTPQALLGGVLGFLLTTAVFQVFFK